MATLSINAALVARFQTVLSLLAFGSAFAIGCNLHYRKIVKNGVAGYPQEWLPSVSATIGDWYPERNVFQIFIALTAAPRFVILFLTYHLYGSTSLFVFGVLRTLSCGGWVYITSSDSGLMHDVLMIGYIVLNIPWMAGSTLMSKGRGVRRGRTAVATMFFATIAPLIYFYIQHKVHRIPGAYSSYAIFEWSLIFFDIFFDSITERELRQTGTYITIGPQRPDSSGSAKDKTATEIPAVSDSNSAPTPKTQSKHEEVAEKSDVAMKTALESALSPPSNAETSAAANPVVPQIPEVQNVFNSKRVGLSFVSDLYRSYVFWSLFTVLIPTLFYFSIWELGVAGQEFTLLTLLTPFFLPTTPFFLPSNAETGIKTWFQMLRSKKGQTIATLVQYSALGAWISDSPVVRLGIVGLSCAAMIQREVVLWAGLVKGEGKAEGRGVRYWSVVVVLGFVSASLSKHVNHGNNPIWPFVDPKNGGWNKTGLALALLSLLEFTTRRPSSSVSAKPKSDSPKPRVVSPRPFLSTFITTSLPLGSLVFSLHNLLADPSTLVAASWTGWENGKPRGPLPHVFGVATMVTLCLGVALGVGASSRTLSRRILTSPVWWFVGCLGAYGLYTERNWEGYGWSLLLAFVLSSVAPGVFEDAAKVARIRSEDDDETDDGQASQLGKVYASAMVVYILFNLASIFTVAYAFIPGGWVFRERTDAVLIAQLLCIAPAFSWPGLKKHKELTSPSSEPEPDSPRTPSSNKYAYITLTLAMALSVFGTLYHLPLAPPRPHKPGSTRILNAGIWTVHFGFDNVGHDSQRGMKALIQDMQLDVVGLLETDLHRTAFGHRDLTRVLVEDLGYNVDIGPGPNEHTWGAVLLSKFPIINTTHHLLPSPHGELAPAIEAVLDVFGTEITVIVAHNGQEEDRLDRELQSTELARIMAASPRPVIFLGYVVTRPHALRPNPYEIMVKDGNVHDIDRDDMDRWCEYIFYRGLYRTSYARVSRGILTDTEMQIGQFVVPKHGTNVTDDSVEARYRRSRKEVLPKDHWFPMEYYGNESGGGKNGHFYHVFYTPLYYDLPEGAVV